MKYAFFLLFFSGCKVEETHVYRSIREINFSHMVSDALSSAENFFKNTLSRVQPLWRGRAEEETPFCQAVLENSPTRDDYIRNWQEEEKVAYCPGSGQLESCQKKHHDAFVEGLLCYKRQ